VGLYAKLGKALIVARENGDDPYRVLDELVGWERFVASVSEAEALALPQSFDYLDFLEAGHHHVRRYAPQLLEAFEFCAAPSARPLLEAVEVLKEMNEKGKRKVPEDAPISFVKPRWRDHVVGAEGEIDRRYYELSALSELKNALRSGDVWVPGSRRYQDFDECTCSRRTRGKRCARGQRDLRWPWSQTSERTWRKGRRSCTRG
jgi:hypothetical protein